MRRASRGNAHGHTLIEVLIVLAITLTVMALVYSLTRVGVRLADATTGRLDRETVALRSLEAMAMEIGRAGYGLVDDAPGIEAVVPPRGQPSRDLVVRSSPEGGGRAPREVRFRFEDGVLTRQIDSQRPQVLARSIAALAFEYLDDTGGPIAPWRVRAAGPLLQAVRVSLTMQPTAGQLAPLEQHLSIGLETQAATVIFDLPPERAFTLRRLFLRLPHAVTVASRPRGESGVALVESPVGCNALYMFPLEGLIGDVRIDTFGGLEEVCDARAAFFAPETSAWAGSLLVVTGDVRSTRVFRVVADAQGRLGPGSPVVPVASTQVLKNLGGAALDDAALYVSDSETGTVYRHALTDPAASFTAVAFLPGSLGPLAFGLDGVLYGVVTPAEGTGGDVLWAIPVDGRGTPAPLARLDGQGRSLAFDPVTGSIYALVQDRHDDSVLLELSRRFLREPGPLPEPAFRLSAWKAEVESAFPPLDPSIPPNLFPPRFGFASFGANGTLYLGSTEMSLVIQSELARPGLGWRKAGLSGIVGADRQTGRPRSLLQAWKK